HAITKLLAAALHKVEHPAVHQAFFDTLELHAYGDAQAVIQAAAQRRINLRNMGDGHSTFGVSLDEVTDREDIEQILRSVVDAYPKLGPVPSLDKIAESVDFAIPREFARTTPYLTHPVFNRYHSETEMLRYIKLLENRDLSLTHAMIPLGSCTMKLNAT